MIDTLLNYFRLDSGKETFRSLPFRLKSIADTLEIEFMPQMEKKRLAFEIVNELDKVVMGDRNLILRIGSNLLFQCAEVYAERFDQINYQIF